MSHSFTERDDDFHPAPADDTWFTETSWFAFIVPERKMAGWLYGWVRPNIGTAGGGVFIWDPSGVDPWEIPYFDHNFSQPLPAERDLRDFTFPYNYSVKMLEPLKRYRLHYTNRKLISLDLEFDAIMPPHPFPKGEPPFVDSPHLDQIGRVTGEIVLRGERIAVDHFAMRDRSWGSRPDQIGLRVGYTYATFDAGTAFCTFGQMKTRDADGAEPLNHGFLMLDGHSAQIASAKRYVTRDFNTNFISGIHMFITDVEGRSFEGRGEVASRMTMSYPKGMNCNALLRWQADGFRGDGWGEDQDCWRYDQWREALLRNR